VSISRKFTTVGVLGSSMSVSLARAAAGCSAPDVFDDQYS
jgi:hypothetical protein